MAQMTKEATRRAYIDAARATYQNDDIEIDDNAKLSEVSDDPVGAWVQAWVWVNEEELHEKTP